MKKLIILFAVISTLFIISGIGVYAESITRNIEGQDYTLDWDDRKYSSFDSNNKDEMIDTFFNVYPQLVKRFNPDASKTVYFVIDPKAKEEHDAPTFTYPKQHKIVFDAETYTNHSSPTGSVVHELSHAAMICSKGNPPSWLKEGVADYVRYKYAIIKSGWNLNKLPKSSDSYKSSYKVTARFFVWLEIHVSPTIIDDMNLKLSEKEYSSDMWIDLTGKKIGKLWSEYKDDPSLD